MRVAHLSWLLSNAGGGIPPVMFCLAAELRRLGHSVKTLGVTDPVQRRLDDAECETHPAIGPLALGYAPGVAVALRSMQPDVLQLHGLFTWSSQVASAWGFGTGKPVVVSPHGMLDEWALRNSAWKKLVFRKLVEDRNLARAACLHALCPAEARSLRRLGLRSPIAILPNGVDVSAIPDHPDRAALGRAYPKLKDRRILLFLGRLHPKKGLLVLLEAWSQLRQAGATGDWAVAVAGPDQLGHAAVLESRARALGISDDFVLTGPLFGDQKAAAMAGASAFVLPSFSEGLPMAVLEAMAWRLPVVVTPHCNVDVATPAAGLMCNPTAEGVAQCLRDLLAMSDNDRRAMGENGRREVEAHYAWDRVAQQLSDVYEWLVHGDPRPDVVEMSQ